MDPKESLSVINGSNLPTTIVQAGDQFFFRLAKEIRAIKDTKDLAACLNRMSNWQDSIKQFTEFVKAKVLEIVQKEGEIVTEKGSKSLKTEHYELRIRPTRTGVDPKKLEKLLRARNLDTGIAMDMEIKFSVNTDKVATCVNNGILSAEDIEQCEYDLTYSVLTPVKL